jgi:hypothetical protein
LLVVAVALGLVILLAACWVALFLEQRLRMLNIVFQLVGFLIAVSQAVFLFTGAHTTRFQGMMQALFLLL